MNKVFLVLIFTCIAGICSGQKKDEDGEEIKVILKKYTCTKCHNQSMRLIGPSFNAIARRDYSKARLVELILKPEPANWPGYPEMPVIDSLRIPDIEKVADWIVRKAE